MITVPNQKIVRIEKEPCGKGNLYAAINLKALEAAAQNLDAGAFKLWIYFAKNQNGYSAMLSAKSSVAEFSPYMVQEFFPLTILSSAIAFVQMVSAENLDVLVAMF